MDTVKEPFYYLERDESEKKSFKFWSFPKYQKKRSDEGHGIRICCGRTRSYFNKLFDRFDPDKSTVLLFEKAFNHDAKPLAYFYNPHLGIEDQKKNQTIDSYINEVFAFADLFNYDIRELFLECFLDDFNTLRVGTDSIFLVQNVTILKKINERLDTEKGLLLNNEKTVKSIQKIKWLGTQKELAELLIRLKEKGWIDDFGRNGIEECFEPTASIRDYLRPATDPKTKKPTHEKLFTKEYKRQFDGIGQKPEST